MPSSSSSSRVPASSSSAAQFRAAARAAVRAAQVGEVFLARSGTYVKVAVAATPEAEAWAYRLTEPEGGGSDDDDNVAGGSLVELAADAVPLAMALRSEHSAWLTANTRHEVSRPKRVARAQAIDILAYHKTKEEEKEKAPPNPSITTNPFDETCLLIAGPP